MMRPRLYIAIACLAAACVSCPSYAATDLAETIETSAEKTLSAPATMEEWKALWKSADEAFAADRYQESLKLYKLAVAKLNKLSDEKEIDDNDSLPFMLALANVFRKLAYYEKSRQIYSGTLEDLSNKESNFLIPILNGLADISLIEGRFDEADSYLTRAVDVSTKQKIESSDSLQSKIYQAQAKLARSKLQDSEKLYLEVVSLASRLGDKGDALKADGWQGLAELELFRMNFKKAEDYSQKALTLRKKIFSEDSLECATSIKTLAESIKTSNPAESQQLGMKALAIQIKKLGTQHHPIVGSTMLSLIDLDASLPQAEQLSIAASHTVDGILRDDTPFMSEYLSKLSYSYFKAQKLKLALETCQRLLDLRTRLYGKQSLPIARTLNFLATVQMLNADLRHDYKQIRFVKEEALIQQAITIAKECSGEMSFDSGNFLYTMGLARYFAADYPAAEDYARRAIRIFDEVRGSDFTTEHFVSKLLLTSLTKQKKMNEARALAGKLLEYQIKKHDLCEEPVYTLFRYLGATELKTVDFPTTKSSALPNLEITRADSIADKILMNTGYYEMSPQLLDGFLRTYEKTEKSSSSNQRSVLLSMALNGAEREYGSDSPKIAGYLVSLGDYYTRVCKYSEAETSLKRAISIIENGLGEEQPLMINALTTYSMYLTSVGKETEAEQQLTRRDKIKSSLEEQYKKLSN